MLMKCGWSPALCALKGKQNELISWHNCIFSLFWDYYREIKPTLSLLISSCERREGSGADTSDEQHKINSHSNNFPLIFFSSRLFIPDIQKQCFISLFSVWKIAQRGFVRLSLVLARRAAGSLQYVRQTSGSPTEGMKDNPQQLTAGSGVDRSSAQLQESLELTQHQSCEGWGREGEGDQGRVHAAETTPAFWGPDRREGSPEPKWKSEQNQNSVWWFLIFFHWGF